MRLLQFSFDYAPVFVCPDSVAAVYYDDEGETVIALYDGAELIVDETVEYVGEAVNRGVNVWSVNQVEDSEIPF